MRYSKGYGDWASVADNRHSPSDRERASLIAARIRDNHSGSSVDSRELARMERIANGPDGYDDWSPPQNAKPNAVSPKPPASQEPEKLTERALEKLTRECFELGRQAAEADWECDDLIHDPEPNSADPTMLSYSERYSVSYHELLAAWTNGYKERAGTLNGTAATPVRNLRPCP